jgi:hypothetical protein
VSTQSRTANYKTPNKEIKMEKYIYDEKNGLHYELVGDYYLPLLTVPEVPPIGIWGRRRQQYLKEHRPAIYSSMLLSDKLSSHLIEVDQQAQDMYDQLMRQMEIRAGITEQLKATDQMAWVQKMNAISNQVREIISTELIYT